MKKTLVFVDGQNLFYSLKNINLTESQINWDSLFSALIEANDELIRVYWYQPQKLSTPHLTIEKARRFIEKDNQGKSSGELDTIAKDALKQAHSWSEDQAQKYQKQLHRYDEMSNTQ